MQTLAVQNLLFDLDGTLVDSAPGVEAAFRSAWKEFAPEGPCPPIRPLMGPPIREMFRRVLPEADSHVLEALVRHFRTTYDGRTWQRTVPFPGVREALTCLRGAGARLFVVTNKPALPTARILDWCGLRPFFEACLSPDSQTPVFPSKTAMILALLAEQRLSPSDAVLIGDTLEDARAAQATGMRFIAFSAGYGWPETRLAESAALICRRFEDLPELLERLPAPPPAGC